MARMGQTTSAPTETGTDGADRAVVRRLVLGSALMLFLELALIRWLGSNIVHLSYFSNFVLLGSFLGIGIGFLVSRRSWTLVPVAPLLLALLVVGVRLFPVSLDRTGSDVIYFTSLQATGPPAWLVLPVVFVVVALVIAGPAEIVGRCFAGLTPLTAYRWDLIGSLIGIGGFTVLSFLWAPPVVWGAIVAVAFVLLVPNLRRLVAVLSGAAVVITLLFESIAPGTSWSPYYKVTTEDIQGNRSFVRISVNGIPHQMMAPAQWKLEQGEQQYTTPYQRIKDNPLDNVLIVGAGSGSDVAIALAKGAKHIDAVDIDPRIMQIGVERNPDRAYQDPRVTRHVNDGRAFLQSTDTKYDLILFALPDSLTLVSGASQIRLESFLFTDTRVDRGPRPPQAGRRVRDVQLLPRALADRPAGGHRGQRLRAHAVRGHLRGRAGRGHGGARRRLPAVRDGLPASRRGDRAGHRRPAVPLLRRRGLPEHVPVGDRLHPVRLRPRAATARRPVPVDASLRRPVLHGGGLPPAGDQERRHLRAVVRDHLAGERLGLRGRAGGRARGRRDDPSGANATPARGVRGHRSIAGRRVRRPARLAAVAAVRAPPGCRRGAGLPADLPGQHRLRQTVQRVGRLARRLRHQHHGRDRGRLPRVRRPAHRLRQPAAGGGRALPGGVPVEASVAGFAPDSLVEGEAR